VCNRYINGPFHIINTMKELKITSFTMGTSLLGKRDEIFGYQKLNQLLWLNWDQMVDRSIKNKQENEKEKGKKAALQQQYPITVTHHLDVGVLSQQAVIGHGLKGEKSSGHVRHSLPLSALSGQQELVLRSWCATSNGVCVCVFVVSRFQQSCWGKGW